MPDPASESTQQEQVFLDSLIAGGDESAPAAPTPAPATPPLTPPLSPKLATPAPSASSPVQESLPTISHGGPAANYDRDFAVQQMAEIQRAIDANVDDTELLFSRLAILQQMSPEVSQKQLGYDSGQFVDNMTREILSDFIMPPWLQGKVPDNKLTEMNILRFLPIFKLPTEFIRWKNRKTEGKGFHWKTLDEHDERVREGLWPPRGRWKQTEEQKSPPVTENINMLGIVLDEDLEAKTPFIIATFAKTSFACGKRLVTSCQQHRLQGMPYWGRFYYLFTQSKTTNNDTYFVCAMQKGDSVPDLPQMLHKNVVNIAAQLADKTNGRSFQERMINAAALDVDEADYTDGGDAGAAQDGEPF